jgi:hypothetical protein
MENENISTANRNLRDGIGLILGQMSGINSQPPPSFGRRSLLGMNHP